MAAVKQGGKWRVDFYFHGERVRKVSPVDTKKGAQEYERLLKRNILAGEGMDKKDTKKWRFDEFAVHWLKTYVEANNKHSTIKSKRMILRVHLIPFFGAYGLDELSSQMVERYKQEKLASGLSAKSISNQLSVLSTMMRCAEEWELIAQMPRIKQIKHAKPDFRYLSDVECVRLIQAGAQDSSKLHAMIMTALHTGMRRGELAALTWDNVDLDMNQIRVCKSFVDKRISTPKSNRTRYIPISTELRDVLIDLRSQGGEYVFSPNGDGPVASSKMRRWLRVACRGAGLERFGWHVLRHTFASQLAMCGVPIRTIQVLMGHSTIQMTERYSHLSPSALSSAVEALNGLKNGKLKTFGQYMVNEKKQEFVPQLAVV